MAQIQDMVKITIKELNLSKVEPVTDTEWNIVNQYLLERCK